MRVNKRKLEIACARACMKRKEIAKETGIPKGSLDGCLSGRSASPAMIGKIARALGVDVLDIIEPEERKGVK